MTRLLDFSAVLRRFRSLRPDPPCSEYATAKCPLKDHENARLRFWVRGGKLLFGCYAGCAKGEILRAVGLTWGACFPDAEKREMVKPRLVARYPYRDEKGAILYEAVRFEPGFDGLRKKDIRYRRRLDGKWAWNIDGVRRVLYRLPGLLTDLAQPVVVTEGEGKADMLAALGLTATCNPCGALAWRTEYAGYLSGRRVAVFPDANEPGMRHALAVAASCIYCDAESIRIVQLPGLTGGQGVDDFLASLAASAETKRRELVRLVRAAPEWRPTG